MVNQAKSEYDCIRLLREIQLMKNLNQFTTSLVNQTNKPTAKNLTAQTTQPTISNLFVPQLIEIICPGNSYNESTPSTRCGSELNLHKELAENETS